MGCLEHRVRIGLLFGKIIQAIGSGYVDGSAAGCDLLFGVADAREPSIRGFWCSARRMERSGSTSVVE